MSSSDTDQNFPKTGDLVDGKFEIQDMLGQGAMGVVFRARQISMEREVAIKFLHRRLSVDASALTRFRREATLACKLRHPNTIFIFDFGVWNELPYLVMELAAGKSLREHFDAGAKFSIAEARRFVDQVGGALAEAHELGIIHRDLKPENIALTSDKAGTISFRVLDFGLAKSIEAEEAQNPGATRQGMFFGTPAYASPEQALAKPLTPATDVYSFGIILYEALSGRVPFEARSEAELLMKHVSDTAAPLRVMEKGQFVRSPIITLVQQCLLKDPEKRPEDGSAILKFLEAPAKAESAPSPISVQHVVVGALALVAFAVGVSKMFPSSDEIVPKDVPLMVTPGTSGTQPVVLVTPEVKETASFDEEATPLPLPSEFPTEVIPEVEITLVPEPLPSPRMPQSMDFKTQAAMDEGLKLFSQKKYSDTIRVLQPVLRSNPRNIMALTTTGLSYEHLHSCEQALVPLKQAALVDPSSALVNYYLARVYSQCFQLKESVAALERAIRNDPTLRQRAASDPLFANISERTEFLRIIKGQKKPKPARRSTVDDFGDRVGETLSNMWYRFRW